MTSTFGAAPGEFFVKGSYPCFQGLFSRDLILFFKGVFSRVPILFLKGLFLRVPILFKRPFLKGSYPCFKGFFLRVPILFFKGVFKGFLSFVKDPYSFLRLCSKAFSKGSYPF